jgi:hypothetical protein
MPVGLNIVASFPGGARGLHRRCAVRAVPRASASWCGVVGASASSTTVPRLVGESGASGHDGPARVRDRSNVRLVTPTTIHHAV